MMFLQGPEARQRSSARLSQFLLMLVRAATVGVAMYHGDPKRYFTEADRALYQAKREGKDCAVLFGASAA